MENNGNKKEFWEAFLRAQKEMPKGVDKDSRNSHFKHHRYTSLGAVMAVVRPILSEHGIAIMQLPGQLQYNDGRAEQPVTTRLMHASSGQSVEMTIFIPLKQPDPQAVGGAITYACRYSLMAMLGVPPHDDDGESAMQRDVAVAEEWGERRGQELLRAATLHPNRINWTAFQKQMLANKTVAELDAWEAQNHETIKKIPKQSMESWNGAFTAHRESLIQKEMIDAGHVAQNSNG